MEWINNKSDEVKRYALNVADYNEKLLEWNVFADFNRALNWAEETNS